MRRESVMAETESVEATPQRVGVAAVVSGASSENTPLSTRSPSPLRELREGRGIQVAALYVAKDGAYSNLAGVDPWDEERDARLYAGPWPVVAHPPCQRWGRYSESHPTKGKIASTGDDGGCFAAALDAVRRWGGVIEHPKDSKAFVGPVSFNLGKPSPLGWTRSWDGQGWICQVEQGHYGHFSRKATWLYACGIELPSLRWGPGEQRIHPVALEKHGYAKARRIGMMAMVGGKNKTRIREATPAEFRDVLIAMAMTANRRAAA